MKVFKERIEKFIKINKMCNAIMNSELEWKEKYDFIFSEDLSQQALKLIEFDWTDPDADYEDDVKAFMNVFNDKTDKFKEILIELEKE